ncbi:uncharacterized protein HMPREF1541_06942 [Cyphellophora europaea CBS 101466]|uniref:DH domain-containing protein n=1 Tax=Cyphellophora europaea (strain CBS 101466) TaxID=1220924 RepID=W2RRI0_CYPE1|nr:uncharacterized protein HMPREF1541_06942 [Cyphellophora europaea CBS 101466]ETN38900.1 hypothetical protein HMPREF1541_06942 [Cyphellophora europaea CBS 101466]
MPTAVSNRNNYYTAHHRRQSGQSQTSLQDQLRGQHPHPPSADSPQAYLPSTSFSQSTLPPLADLHQSNELQNPTSNLSVGYDEASGDPDDFYRQYHEGQEPSKGLHQDALRTANLDDNPLSRTRKSSVASTASQDRHAPRTSKNSVGSRRSLQPNGSRPAVRKSSFKDLVARFDASPDDIPPVPWPVPGSRKASPVMTVGPQGNTWKHAASASMAQQSHVAAAPAQQTKKQRPLFGEVLPGVATSNAAGYGIAKPRRRRGSEGSPMHSPNPMFPDNGPTFHAPAQLHQSQPTNGDERRSQFPVESAHRRAVSDLSPVDSSAAPRSSQPREAGLSALGKLHGRQLSASRIPVSSRRLSLDSGSGTSTPSSRAQSKAGHYPAINAPSSRSKIPTPSSVKTAPSSFNQKTRAPNQIRSPGRQGRNINATHSQKSPSLRANIIAPPPKNSPPLRSSRPRLPVSSASTAASRAKIAERFQAMAKEQTDLRAASRRARPPELSDIDLKQRRLKITQALSRSREGQDLRGERPVSKRRSGSATPSLSEPERGQEVYSPSNIPAVVVEGASFADDGDVFTTPDEATAPSNSQLTQAALSTWGMPGSFDDGSDSPTLGSAEGGTELDLPQLQIPQAQRRPDRDENSVLAQGTAGTTFDAEPQADTSDLESGQHSLFHQIRSIREPSSASSPSGISPSEGQTLDRTDAESVNLVLRNTTYMDEDEAVAKGYRNFMQPPLPDLYEGSSNGQGSWTSSIAEHSDASPRPSEDPKNALFESPIAGKFEVPVTVEERSSSPTSEANEEHDEAVRTTAASDAYTIVNIVLQERSSSGLVDQQLVDDIFERIISEEPDLVRPESVDPQRIEELCLQELELYGNADRPESVRADNITGESTFDDEDEDDDNEDEFDHDERRPPPLPKDSLPPSSFRTHTYKSSLDSAEDWADTSPSVGDWMQFALNRSETEKAAQPSPLAQDTGDEDDGDYGTVAILQYPGEPPVPPKDDILSPPSHSPPPPPTKQIHSLERISTTSIRAQQVPISSPPEMPHRMTSTSQMATRRATQESSNLAPSPAQDEQTAEAKRLKQRRNIMKELVDTEFTYERDMRVLCDIYKQTATAVLDEEDVKIVFGNVEQIQEFSKDFLTYLKQMVKSVYVMDRKNRATNSHLSDRTSIRSISPDLTDDEKDRLTQVGVAFEASMDDMSAVYTDYIRQRHAANKRLTMLSSMPAVADWLRECSENSKDITHAWSLDALSVKPVQRITKYPLLLSGLLESTPADHPDVEGLRRALTAVTDINFRINDIKKQTELVDQVLSRKRKESDVRNGLTKAFGRRAERLRQHVGVSDVFEDGEYSRLKMEYDNNGVHLLIVSKDCQGYLDAIRGWVSKWAEMAAAAEGWVDVGHSNYPEAESKLRQLGMVVKGISTIALPDHIDQVSKKVIQPMEQAMLMMERFKTDPKGLYQKRDKKILDYSTAKNKRDRGEKLDRKMTERLDQWEAINNEVKQRMRKLLQATQTLVHSCLHSLVQLHMSWLAMMKQKLAGAMAIPLEKLEQADLVKDWQVDFDFHEATALTLSICNGALLAEAANISSFLSPGTTLAGEDSPRPSWNSGKRTTSLSSDHSHMPQETYVRYSSGQHSAHEFPTEASSFGAANSRMRATSTTSGRAPGPKTPEMYSRTPSSLHSFSRPATSLGQVDRPAQSESAPIKTTLISAPRVSLDTPSPSIGPIAPLGTPNRPGSASTFFSATAGPSTTSHTANNPSMSTTSTVAPSVSTGTTAGPPAQGQASSASSIFSSAMPMPDSPVADRALPTHPPGVSPGAGEDPDVLFTAASVYEFNIDRARQEGGIPYLTYVAGEIFDVIGERGELWLARNQDDPTKQVGWIWCKHFAKLAS